jgi:LysR family glycine cleavage system transcriptional activator
MQDPRRFLPSISLLSAFEATARTGSVTQAAKELNLTQGAVSRQIKVLEQQLEADLFQRTRQTLILTLAGEAYVREVRAALRRISNASLALRGNPQGGSLNLAILPTFGTRWLTPRLPQFFDQNPSIKINLITRSSPFEFEHESIDAAIHYGTDDWQGVQAAHLCDEVLLPVCSPALSERCAFTQPRDVRDAPLLHMTSRPDAWEQWFAANGASEDTTHGMLFDQLTTLCEAAMAGLGVALLPEFLFRAELASGRLLKALDRPMAAQASYYLVWPIERASHPPLVAFRRWISQAIQQSVDAADP